MLHFVINPKAGNGKGKQVWNKIRRILEHRQITYEWVITKFAGEAADICRSLAEGAGGAPDGQDEESSAVTIVMIGGDGTLNEAVHGLMTANGGRPLSRKTRVAFLPAGSGNDFARGHGIPLDPEQALELLLAAIRSGQGQYIDVLEVNGRFAASSVGVGLDGEVAYEANLAPYKQWMNRIGLGFAAYVLSLLRVLLSYQLTDAEILVDGESFHVDRLWLAAVSNIPHYGGGMKINPAALPDDGIADLCVVSGVSRAGLLAAFPKVYSGRHVNHPHVRFFRGSDIRIIPQNPVRLHADGEHAGLSPARIRVVAKGLFIVK